MDELSFFKRQALFLGEIRLSIRCPRIALVGCFPGTVSQPPPFAINLYAILIRCASTFHETLSQPLRA